MIDGKPTLNDRICDFIEDVVANLSAATTKESACDAMRAITLDALLLEQSIKNEYDTQASANAE